jgi:ribosomal protein S17E
MKDDIADLKKELDDQLQRLTEKHGQKYAERRIEHYVDSLSAEDFEVIKPVIDQLISCEQKDFYRLWHPIVDLCLIKNFKLFNRIDSDFRINDNAVSSVVNEC